jgi:hypothetical protein
MASGPGSATSTGGTASSAIQTQKCAPGPLWMRARVLGWKDPSFHVVSTASECQIGTHSDTFSSHCPAWTAFLCLKF